jgi:hypothetical protein
MSAAKERLEFLINEMADEELLMFLEYLANFFETKNLQDKSRVEKITEIQQLIDQLKREGYSA